MNQKLDEFPDRWVQASCFLCSNGCDLDIGLKDDRPGGRIVGVRGREADVVNAVMIDGGSRSLNYRIRTSSSSMSGGCHVDSV
ncbi:MAG: hypothetical protein WBE92_00150 [Steroidobacteraceae bacterium]